MIVRILLVSLITAAIIFTTFGSHFIVTPIQAKTSNHDDNSQTHIKAKTSNHDDNSQTHIKAKTSNHDDNSQTIRVNCSDLRWSSSNIKSDSCRTDSLWKNKS